MSQMGQINQVGQIIISSDKNELDVEKTHGFLKRSTWAAKRTRETLLKSIQNSICFGAYVDGHDGQGGQQVAFARVVTDGCTFAYLCDVFVDEAYRGRGISKQMMTEIMKHPELQSFRRFTLATKDAHGLYAQFGFQNVDAGRFMQIQHDGV